MRSSPAWLLLLAAAGCGVETDDRPATFSYIHEAIIVPSCATAACHSTQNHISGVDMQDRAAAYAEWDDVDAKEFSAIYGLIGGEVDTSAVVLPEAGRMPLDSPLPEADILLIGRWIDDGAENN
ncbi:MAG: hypothetical protein F9K40_07300 [Kofleriaceae bacterium]|nr:MAG: hypothetical protein F9K40_07300 [Kofleriaceae bacterium]MBZ0234313.1 hypothetical protein [Kofleriaceae bacterium]